MNYIKQFMDDNYIDYERPVRLSEEQYRVEQINPIFVDLLSGKIKDLRTTAQPF